MTKQPYESVPQSPSDLRRAASLDSSPTRQVTFTEGLRTPKSREEISIIIEESQLDISRMPNSLNNSRVSNRGAEANFSVLSAMKSSLPTKSTVLKAGALTASILAGASIAAAILNKQTAQAFGVREEDEQKLQAGLIAGAATTGTLALGAAAKIVRNFLSQKASDRKEATLNTLTDHTLSQSMSPEEDPKSTFEALSQFLQNQSGSVEESAELINQTQANELTAQIVSGFQEANLESPETVRKITEDFIKLGEEQKFGFLIAQEATFGQRELENSPLTAIYLNNISQFKNKVEQVLQTPSRPERTGERDTLLTPANAAETYSEVRRASSSSEEFASTAPSKKSLESPAGAIESPRGQSITPEKSKSHV